MTKANVFTSRSNEVCDTNLGVKIQMYAGNKKKTPPNQTIVTINYHYEESKLGMP